MTKIKVIGLLIISFAAMCTTNNSKEHDWDVLIFTQHWPVTVCLQWKEKEEQHTCSFPPVKNIWTIHGIWPSKLGTRGPQYCNSSLHFDLNALQPIRQKLDQYWINVYNGTESALWKHEWQRHGTCAASLPDLNSELKYFSKGLEWLEAYGMDHILPKAGIKMDYAEGFSAQEFSDAVVSVLGVDPDIQCIEDKGNAYLFEIRICFNKTLELVDCDGIKMKTSMDSLITNCPHDKPIFYPSKLPSLPEGREISYSHYSVKSQWPLRLLKVIQFLQWFTF
ncbi:ribonuclease Oy [Schistocerca piceifrons]|uniref:ribonuclease Oy n=1 Tax=Schistocerca piceifrons TaxID=274613 RepID=UPI001F5F27A1|nr:ribonuclease Oy [Schistocerca piceifrons]XP_047119186.1 ribonuclease Oy [Schistocerca piceifrons]XP_049940447.1 ribonuclease Oy [Schistocerca serialis cubense]XP_049940448.1 ribonuclease Oy [Schistocerca serialis cubense]